MARDPEEFRYMTASQIMTTLMVDEINAKHTKARSVGASCADCLDTGMSGGRFCGCNSGSKLALQSYGGNRP